MAKKCKCPEGVPEWIVTFGDMMSLLLCFFVLLAAISEIKKPREYEEIVKAIQEQMGMTGGWGRTQDRQNPDNSLIKKLDEMRMDRGDAGDNAAVTPEISQDGDQTTVQRIREGTLFTIGGMISFEPGSAELKPAAVQELLKVAEAIRGKNTKLEIKGHTSSNDMNSADRYKTSRDLSYARASAVADVLTGQGRVAKERVRVTACENFEPLASRVYEEEGHARNRRIEVIAMEALVQDFVGSDSGAGPSNR